MQVTVKVDFETLSFQELVNIIVECQKELWDRGTTTKCYNIYNHGKDVPVYLGVEKLKGVI
jgi:hypothetical protein